MDREQSIAAAIAFRCPRYQELPDMGLYLEQVLNLVNTALNPIQSEPLTGAMISNYGKNKAIPAPEKKKYSREHLARSSFTGCPHVRQSTAERQLL